MKNELRRSLLISEPGETTLRHVPSKRRNDGNNISVCILICLIFKSEPHQALGNKSEGEKRRVGKNELQHSDPDKGTISPFTIR